MIKGLFQEVLRCELTGDEVAVRANQLAITQKDIEENEAEAKGAAETFKAARKRLEHARNILAREVRERSTFRQVDCQESFTTEDGLVWVERIRQDTGEVVERRLATDTEKQKELPLTQEAP